MVGGSRYSGSETPSLFCTSRESVEHAHQLASPRIASHRIASVFVVPGYPLDCPIVTSLCICAAGQAKIETPWTDVQFFRHNGSQLTPISIPTRIPKKERPVWYWLKPWFVENTSAND